jgi:hypothetical protein
MPRVGFGFHSRRVVDVSVDAPIASSDVGLVLIRQLDERLGFCATFEKLLVDARDPRLTLHAGSQDHWATLSQGHGAGEAVRTT